MLSEICPNNTILFFYSFESWQNVPREASVPLRNITFHIIFSVYYTFASSSYMNECMNGIPIE